MQKEGGQISHRWLGQICRNVARSLSSKHQLALTTLWRRYVMSDSKTINYSEASVYDGVVLTCFSGGGPFRLYWLNRAILSSWYQISGVPIFASGLVSAKTAHRESLCLIFMQGVMFGTDLALPCWHISGYWAMCENVIVVIRIVICFGAGLVPWFRDWCWLNYLTTKSLS